MASANNVWTAPFGSSGSDDYFDRHKFNELKKRFDSTANDPRAKAAFKKEITSKKVTRILQKTPTKRRVEFDDGSQGWVVKGDENKIVYL